MSIRNQIARRVGFALLIACAAACAHDDLTEKLPEEMFAAVDALPAKLQGRHIGPAVIAGDTGPARFVGPLHQAFDGARAMETVAFVDRFYRAPANDGYEAVIDAIAARLADAGFGKLEGFELEVLDTPLTARTAQTGERATTAAWTPLAGRLELIASDATTRALHDFTTSEARDRTMLPINAPSCDVTGGIALSLDELDAGELLVTDAKPSPTLLARAEKEGAAAVVSAHLEPYNADPSGRFRHLDAIQFRTLHGGATLPLCMISPRSLQVIHTALDADAATKLHFKAEIKLDQRKLRTLCARIVGSDRANEAVAVVSHVQEPGACDNASGVAGLCETACNLADLIQRGDLQRPSRSLVFLWGDEFLQTSIWLDSTKLKPIAGLSSDMTGESRDKTGAIALLERMPDPGALEPLEPDAHTPWGKAEVDPAKFLPNGLALIARCALLDVGALPAEGVDGWETADHPYEGGSDHDVFIARGIPAALIWHFIDFAYHTSLDRLEHVDAGEMRRTGVALMATALALADPRAADLERYLLSLNEEENVRVAAATAAGMPELAEQWRQWCDGARQWLRVECLRIPSDELPPTSNP